MRAFCFVLGFFGGAERRKTEGGRAVNKERETESNKEKKSETGKRGAGQKERGREIQNGAGINRDRT